ncbi:uncharacterized protein LOC128983919 [Macrosteles quadrilineatus]|uniref:uncharacterized protein LOC128983919 n=1 Tax=Macrosteles quadrilineatus TaxID=74068 RepID=UPI0023E28DAE|nr:uncharacterized protein LOC128983919 [Macrosteles quadrilineatus]
MSMLIFYLSFLLLLIQLVGALPRLFDTTSEKSEPQQPQLDNLLTEMSDEDFYNKLNEAHQEKQLVVIEFYATWYRPSKTTANLFNEYAIKFPKVIFIKLDVDTHRKIAAAETYKIDEKGQLPIFWFKGKGGDRLVIGAKKETFATTFEQTFADFTESTSS